MHKWGQNMIRDRWGLSLGGKFTRRRLFHTHHGGDMKECRITGPSDGIWMRGTGLGIRLQGIGKCPMHQGRANILRRLAPSGRTGSVMKRGRPSLSMCRLGARQRTMSITATGLKSRAKPYPACKRRPCAASVFAKSNGPTKKRPINYTPNHAIRARRLIGGGGRRTFLRKVSPPLAKPNPLPLQRLVCLSNHLFYSFSARKIAMPEE